MSLPHIPVRILAADPAEYQALADVLAAGQVGAVALAAPDETPVAVILCPSGNAGDAADLPVVALGAHPGASGAASRSISVPASVADVLDAVEALAGEVAGLGASRDLGGWRLDPARLSLRGPAGDEVGLTDTEARLLACLLDARGQSVARDILLQRVWGYRPGLDTHTLETHIYRLRKKIEADPAAPKVIVTNDDGYHFAAQE